MTDIIEEISTLMDGEKTRDTKEDLIDNLRNDPSLKNVWQRFHIIRDALSSEDAKKDFATFLKKAKGLDVKHSKKE